MQKAIFSKGYPEWIENFLINKCIFGLTLLATVQFEESYREFILTKLKTQAN